MCAAAGLGGGSANAATALWAANELSGRPASDAQLQDWAGDIGSDISVFFSGGAAYCTSRWAYIVKGAPPASCQSYPIPQTSCRLCLLFPYCDSSPHHVPVMRRAMPIYAVLRQNSNILDRRGEVVEDVEPPLPQSTPLLLVKPPVGLSTPAVFKALDLEACSSADPQQLLSGAVSLFMSTATLSCIAVLVLQCCQSQGWP